MLIPVHKGKGMIHFEEDIRKTRVWQEGYEEGFQRGLEEGSRRERVRIVRRCLDRGMSTREISELLELSMYEVRRLSKSRD